MILIPQMIRSKTLVARVIIRTAEIIPEITIVLLNHY